MMALLVALSLTGCSHASGVAPHQPRAATGDTLRFGRFGPLVLYRQSGEPSRVILLVSGNEGWNAGVGGLAEDIAGLDALVVGIDLRRYLAGVSRLHQRCAYAAADFEALSQWIQRRLNFPRYTPPILMGYASGGALVHATLAQSPPGTFAGAIGLGHSPDLPLRRTFCNRVGLSAQHHAGGWIVLQPAADPSRGESALWLSRLGDALADLDRASLTNRSTPGPAVRDLPLVELPAAGESRTLAVVVSGDGGWAGLDREIGESLSLDGVSVVGINSLDYFWHTRTPDGAAADLTRVLRHYMPAWGASRILLVGYSRGSDVLPFMASRLPADLREQVRLVALLGFSHRAGFEIHLTDFLGGSGRGLPTVPEVGKLRGLHILCVYGSDETDSACRDLSPSLATALELHGGHHFGGAYGEIARRILSSTGITSGWPGCRPPSPPDPLSRSAP